MLENQTYFQYHPVNIATVKGPPYNLMPKDLDNQLSFINSNESWKISSLFLKLESFTHILSIKMLKDLIFVLLLDSHV